MNIGKILAQQAQVSPDKPAIIFEDNSITFSELKNASFKLAGYFSQLDIKPADKIAVFLPNIPEAAFTFFGVFSSGF